MIKSNYWQGLKVLKQKENNLGFKYERKRIKRDKKLPPLCSDYDPDNSGYCKKANLCKNATYGSEEKPSGICFGGTKNSEIEHRKKYLLKGIL